MEIVLQWACEGGSSYCLKSQVALFLVPLAAYLFLVPRASLAAYLFLVPPNPDDTRVEVDPPPLAQPDRPLP